MKRLLGFALGIAVEILFPFDRLRAKGLKGKKIATKSSLERPNLNFINIYN